MDAQLSTAMRLREDARARNPQGTKCEPISVDELEDIRTQYGRGVANLCEYPHWLLSSETSKQYL